MFICEVCKKNSVPNEKPVKTVIETRKKVYYSRIGEFEGEGFETVREIMHHLACYPIILGEKKGE